MMDANYRLSDADVDLYWEIFAAKVERKPNGELPDPDKGEGPTEQEAQFMRLVEAAENYRTKKKAWPTVSEVEAFIEAEKETRIQFRMRVYGWTREQSEKYE